MVGNTARKSSDLAVDPNPLPVNTEGGDPMDPRTLAMRSAYLGAEAAVRTNQVVKAATERMLEEIRPVLAEILQETNRAILLANGYDRETAEEQKLANAAGAVAGADPTQAPHDWPTREEVQRERDEARGWAEARHGSTAADTSQGRNRAVADNRAEAEGRKADAEAEKKAKS